MKTKKLGFKLCNPIELQEYQDELIKIEKEFIYPLNNEENFFISHGDFYSHFFERMGDPRFLLVFYEEKIIGIISATKKKVKFKNKERNCFYLADLKIKKAYRGQSISNQIYWEILKIIPFYPYAWKASFFYFVGMIGKEGDVSRSFGKSLPAKMVRPIGKLKIYFAEPEALSRLSASSFDPKNEDMNSLNLSSSLNKIKESPNFTSLQGIKDIVLEQSGEAMRMAHVNLNQLTDSQVLFRLRSICNTKESAKFDQFCFSLDERRSQLIEFLESQDIVAQSEANILGFSLYPKLFKNSYITLNSDEI